MAKKNKEHKIYGEAAVRAFFKSRKDDLIRLYVREGEQGRFKEILSRCAKEKKLYRLVKNDELEKISESLHHEGICAVCLPKAPLKVEELVQKYKQDFKSDPLIVLDQVDNPHNIGAIIRTATFFGFKNLIVVSKTNYSLSGSIARTSEGGIEYANIAYLREPSNLIEILKDNQVPIHVSDPASNNSDLLKITKNKPYSIVFGNEAFGVSKVLSAAAHSRFKIKGSGDIQSLNVSVAAGVILQNLF